MKLISWNVNGIRAAVLKNSFEWVADTGADFLALQETKVRDEDFPKQMYELRFLDIKTNSAQKAGYSGVATLLNFPCITMKSLFNDDNEGRVLEHRYKNIAIFNIYFPNGQKDESRLAYKMEFYKKFLNYINSLVKDGTEVIFMGDVNTAHNDIDIKNPRSNDKRSGFLHIERDFLDEVVRSGFVDTFRHLNPNLQKFSWWSYRFKARQKDIGWRIDYVFVSKNLLPLLKNAFILSDITGSDHCPVGIEIDI